MGAIITAGSVPSSVGRARDCTVDWRTGRFLGSVTPVRNERCGSSLLRMAQRRTAAKARGYLLVPNLDFAIDLNRQIIQRMVDNNVISVHSDLVELIQLNTAPILRSAAPASSASRVLPFAAVAIFCLFTIALGWVGYIQSDDLFYAQAAQAWARDGFFVGQSHWGLRHLIVLPMAGLFALFGRSEWTLVAPMLASAVALIAMTFWSVRQVSGTAAALIVVTLLASIPLIAGSASTVYSDLPEAVMVVLSAWAFFFACRKQETGRDATRLFVLSGCLAGLAFITRETTLALLALYGILFLAGYGERRWSYVWMGIGFGVVVALDYLFLGLATGDPLYRLHVTLRGVAGDNPSMAHLFPTDGMFDRHGVIIAPRWLQAPLMLLANQAIGPALWLAIPATILLCLQRQDTAQRRAARLLGLLALIWFVILSYGLQSLWLVPRYQTVSVIALTTCLGMQLATLAASKRKLLAGAVIGALLAVNLSLLSLGGRDPIFGERALAEASSKLSGVIYTDPATLEASEWLLEIAGTQARVAGAPPPPNALYALNPRPRRRLPADWPTTAPQQGWVPVLEITEPPRLGARLLDALGVGPRLPAQVRNKLAPAPLRLVVYRTPG